MQADKTPVEAIEAQMLCQPVFELIFAGVEGLDVANVGFDCELELVWQREGWSSIWTGDERHGEFGGGGWNW